MPIAFSWAFKIGLHLVEDNGLKIPKKEITILKIGDKYKN